MPPTTPHQPTVRNDRASWKGDTSLPSFSNHVLYALRLVEDGPLSSLFLFFFALICLIYAFSSLNYASLDNLLKLEIILPTPICFVFLFKQNTLCISILPLTFFTYVSPGRLILLTVTWYIIILYKNASGWKSLDKTWLLICHFPRRRKYLFLEITKQAPTSLIDTKEV